MSAGRRYRRQMDRRLAEPIQKAAGERARYRGDYGPYEMWVRGSVMILVPKVPLGAPAEVAAAVSRRRLAGITGTCECGATYRPHRGRLQMAHEVDCPASDKGLRRVLDLHGWAARWLDDRGGAA